MTFLDALLGRTRPVQPNLDILFTVPAAVTTLQVTLGLAPTGVGAVCFRAAEGSGAAATAAEAIALLPAEPDARTDTLIDRYGWTWMVRRRTDADIAALVTDLHAANATLADAGFGPALLCTVIGFAGTDPTRRLGLVYLFKRGTFYPFAPTGAQQRDTEFELRVRAGLAGELPIERDLTRWFPVWDCPAL